MKVDSIHYGDCLKVLPDFPDGSVDLIYVDPPFFSGKEYAVIWGENNEVRAFEDRWKGGSRGINVYIEWMEPRIRECHRVLKDTGTFYLHCDWHANYRLRDLLDAIFGPANFGSEIIWKRTTAHADTRGFGHVHDTILRYTRSDEFTWNPEYRPYSQEYIQKYFKERDEYYEERGPFWPGDLTGAGLRKGESGKPWRGVDPAKIGKGRHWMYGIEELERLDAEGRIYWPKRGKIPKYKRYLSETKGGNPVDTIWDDIPSLGGLKGDAEQRLGFPTQKPEGLLDRIIKTSSNLEDLVLDPMCGCGTAIAVAQKLKRRWIGVDISLTACKLMVRRMQKLGVQIREANIIGHPMTPEELMEMPPFEFQNWGCLTLGGRVNPKKTGEGGVDGWMLDGTPIQVKQHQIGRPDVDPFETTLDREKKKRGVMLGFGFSQPAEEERARAKLEKGLEIDFVKVEDLMAGRFDASRYSPIEKYL